MIQVSPIEGMDTGVVLKLSKVKKKDKNQIKLFEENNWNCNESCIVGLWPNSREKGYICAQNACLC